MKITALVENQAADGLKAKHGLSLYIETEKHKLLFDLGPDRTLFANAAALGIDLTAVDTVILSHGHNDHGGALRRFLALNRTAKVYVQRSAFEAHYSKVLFFRVGIGLDRELMRESRLVLLDGDHVIDDELRLFTAPGAEICRSPANDTLLDERGTDAFSHEQSLLITENKTALIMGCGHRGVLTILAHAPEAAFAACIGGYHLYNPAKRQTVGEEVLFGIAEGLRAYPKTEFYTCHCTGRKAYDYLAARLPNMHYLSAGTSITV